MSEETQNLKQEPSHSNMSSNLNAQSIDEKADILAAFNQMLPMKLDFDLNSEQQQKEQEALRKQVIQQARLKFIAYQQHVTQQNMQDTAQINPLDNINKPQEYHKHSSATGSSGFSTDFTSQPSQPSSFKKDFSLE